MDTACFNGFGNYIIIALTIHAYSAYIVYPLYTAQIWLTNSVRQEKGESLPDPLCQSLSTTAKILWV
ncbi:hypothetical protein BDV23DRAFT_154700 [Aspergillus alliaceus]|uniref:Uncharacterized protein n=1 Tax=Petromyces alliaceus TaxID=209559 RepID=A0A5N7C998_PETAA|nr:hypothetical protein BDV23DRAFT_154700 [Aspergillus alliaceus]